MISISFHYCALAVWSQDNVHMIISMINKAALRPQASLLLDSFEISHSHSIVVYLTVCSEDSVHMSAIF